MMALRDQRGFTLLEVLVTFVLAAMLLAVILSGFGTGLSSLSRMEKMAQAALIAQSRLAELGLVQPFEEGEYSGVTEDSQVSFRWRVLIRPFDWGYSAELRERDLVLYKVEVDVFWPAAVGEHSYQLGTLRAESSGQP